MFTLVLQKLLLEAILDVFYFPLWWYTGGVWYAALRAFEFLRMGNRALAPGLWIQNLFVPMFGQFDWQGRIISFLMRFIQIIFRLAALAVWLVVCLLIFAFWLAIPIIIIWGLITALTMTGKPI